jgi:hypothetical protein
MGNRETHGYYSPSLEEGREGCRTPAAVEYVPLVHAGSGVGALRRFDTSLKTIRAIALLQ